MAKPVARVLVIARGPLGVFVPALMAIERIRAAHAAARITLLTAPAFEALARACPHIDEVDAEGDPETFGEWAELVGRLRAGRYHRVYDLENSAETRRLFHLLRPFPPPWSGAALGCAFPARDARRADMHPLERLASQLKAAGVWPDAPVRPGSAPPADASWIARRTTPAPDRRPGPVLLIPGEAADPPEARWPAEAFAEFILAIRARGHEVIVLGGPGDGALVQAIQRRAPARDMTGRTDYAQIAGVGARAALAVGADTAIMSLVAAAGAPCLVLRGADHVPARPALRGHVAVLRAETLAGLDVGDVLRAAAHLLPISENHVMSAP
jgi:ADP-heptose:LPS heptosyltransferase